jgi:nucleoside phosphorylase
LRILVTFALEQEFAPWRRLRKFARLNGNRNPAFQASLGEADLRVVLTGAGRAATRRAMEDAFVMNPDVCISAGIAGGLQQGQRIGDVLVARRVQELSSQRIIESDSALLELAGRTGAKVARSFCTSHFALSDADSKMRMSRMGDAVEMESYHILEAAGHHGARGVAVRALSDLVDESLPFDFTAMLDEQGSVNYGRLAVAVAKSPRRIPAMFRLALQARVAARAIAQFLDAYVSVVNGWKAQAREKPGSAKAEVA